MKTDQFFSAKALAERLAVTPTKVDIGAHLRLGKFVQDVRFVGSGSR